MEHWKWTPEPLLEKNRQDRSIVTFAFFPCFFTSEAITAFAVCRVHGYPGRPELHAALLSALVGLLYLSWTLSIWAHWFAWADLLPPAQWAYVLFSPRKISLGSFTIFLTYIWGVRIIDSKGGNLVETQHFPVLTVALPELTHWGVCPGSLYPSSPMVSKCHSGASFADVTSVHCWLDWAKEGASWLVLNLLASESCLELSLREIYWCLH